MGNFPRDFFTLQKREAVYCARLPFRFPVGAVLPRLYEEAKRLRFDHVFVLVAGDPEDAEDICSHDERSVRTDSLRMFFHLQLMQFGNALDEVSILFGRLIQTLQRFERGHNFSVELSTSLTLGKHTVPFVGSHYKP